MKYKYHIYGDEPHNKPHNKPHVHIYMSDGRNLVLSLPDLEIIVMAGQFKSREVRILKKELGPIANKLLKEYNEKNK